MSGIQNQRRQLGLRAVARRLLSRVSDSGVRQRRVTGPSFTQLNDGWNAFPNGSDSYVSVEGDKLFFEFKLDMATEPDAVKGDPGVLTFSNCTRWRLGDINDHGWYAGQCRYSAVAPSWGEFYEITGEDPARLSLVDWQTIGPDAPDGRHFLFYLRDETFECVAADWSFARKNGAQR